VDSQPVTTELASAIHPDILKLAQQIVDETEALVSDVETLDANKWLSHADKLDSLNHQLQNLLIGTK
jgi:hypothetical protein